MGTWRNVALVIACGFIPVIVDTIFDGGWPDWSAQRWLVFLAGLGALAVIFVLVDAAIAAHKSTDRTSSRR